MASTSATSTPAAGSSAMSASTASSSSSSSTANTGKGITTKVDVSQVLNSFMTEIGMAQREVEIERVIKAFKLNPLVILGLPATAGAKEVNKQYRNKSLLCHPDKVTSELRDRAQTAFSKLAAAKAELLDEEKRTKLNEMYMKARVKISDKREAEKKKKNKLWRKKNPNSKKDPPVVEWPIEFEKAVETEVNEMLIDAEWRRRQYLKMAAEEDGKAQKAKEEKAKERELAKKEDETWEQNRGKRVNNWRSFSKSNKRKKKIKPKRSKDAQAAVKDRRYFF